MSEETARSEAPAETWGACRAVLPQQTRQICIHERSILNMPLLDVVLSSTGVPEYRALFQFVWGPLKGGSEAVFARTYCISARNKAVGAAGGSGPGMSRELSLSHLAASPRLDSAPHARLGTPPPALPAPPQARQPAFPTAHAMQKHRVTHERGGIRCRIGPSPTSSVRLEVQGAPNWDGG